MQPTQPTSKRFTILDKEKYSVDLEYNEQYAILHLPYVEKFTKSLYLDIVSTLEGWDSFFKSFGYNDIWVAVRPEDNSISKLVKKLGFEHRGNAEGYDVYNKGI